MSETPMSFDPSQFAVVIERLDNVKAVGEKTSDSLRQIELSLAEMKRLPTEVAELRRQLDSQGQEITRHKTILKITASVLALSVGLIGWGWNEGKELFKADAAADRRLFNIEYRLNIHSESKEGPK